MIIEFTHIIIKLYDLYLRILVGTCDYSRQILERSYVIYKMKETETSRERERERVDIKANKWKTHYIIGFDYEIR